jgi:NodT family efflux transporter outer membrane factor (OMF) lipoprotein
VQKTYGSLFFCFCVASCTVGPDFKVPQAPPVQSYTADPLPNQTPAIKDRKDERQIFSFGEEMSHDWWTLFQCEPLNQLIKRGLVHNPTIHAAQASLQQSLENLAAGQGAFFPTVTGQYTPQKQRVSPAQYGGLTGFPSLYNLFNLSFSISYTLDIFGGIRRQVEALEAQVDYQRFEKEATYLALTSNIVMTAIQEASLREQIEATREIIGFQEEQLGILKSQFELGGTSQVDVLSQETLVAQTKATLPPLENSLSQARHYLSVLVGAFPCEGGLPMFTLRSIRLPKELPVTLPSELVRQRPDIQAAEALLHQASAGIGVARSHLFPQLTLAGTRGFMSNQFHDQFSSGAPFWSLASTLLQPIFQGGTLVAQENAAVAAYNQAFATYRQTVLVAFQNVADALQALVDDARTVHAELIAEEASHKSLALTQKQFQLGAVNFIILLTAQRDYQQARIKRIQAEASRYVDTAGLFKALGGGWWNREPQQ